MGKQKRNAKAMAQGIRDMAAEWLIYKDMVIDPRAGQVQIEAMKNAFYAGSFVTQGLIIEISSLPSEEVAETKLTELLKETKKELGVK